MPRRFFLSASLIAVLLFNFSASAALAEPLASESKVAPTADADGDGLSDSLELAFGTDSANPDFDGDGYPDGLEVQNGYDPRDPTPKRLTKSVSIHTKSQKLAYYLDGVKLGEFTVSTGKKKTPTPSGEFTITKKAPKAWSKMAGLWMPWWINFTGPKARPGLYAIHELPIWPGGKREGASHLGKPVSGGCVRLGIGAAKFIYDWAPIGTKVVITAD
ncbi:murein L,D-transpeptidase [Patescibacteria group bacterium]|nr:MAG: murein L,D-transpeptidase [Patescibacteria group bacterium]